MLVLKIYIRVYAYILRVYRRVYFIITTVIKKDHIRTEMWLKYTNTLNNYDVC
jgi:hypothetical protein